MTFTRTELPDVIIIEPKVFQDERGYFSEIFRNDLLEEFISGKTNFFQDNESKSSYGVLRGLHFQIPPFAQTKLVRVIKGKVLDIVVDIRKSSTTYGKHISIELSEDNKKQIFIPQGFAHGFVVLSDEAIFNYKVDNKYSPLHERGVVFSDKSLDIDWKVNNEDLIITSKDELLKSFDELEDYFTE